MLNNCNDKKGEVGGGGEETPNDRCSCCYSLTKLKLCTYKCWQFIVATFFSICAFIIAFWGLMGGFELQDNTFYSNLITFVLGVWLPSPTMKPDKKKEKKLDLTSRKRDDLFGAERI